jgi:hypothetical protein
LDSLKELLSLLEMIYPGVTQDCHVVYKRVSKVADWLQDLLGGPDESISGRF